MSCTGTRGTGQQRGGVCGGGKREQRTRAEGQELCPGSRSRATARHGETVCKEPALQEGQEGSEAEHWGLGKKKLSLNTFSPTRACAGQPVTDRQTRGPSAAAPGSQSAAGGGEGGRLVQAETPGSKAERTRPHAEQPRRGARAAVPRVFLTERAALARNAFPGTTRRSSRISHRSLPGLSGVTEIPASSHGRPEVCREPQRPPCSHRGVHFPPG